MSCVGWLILMDSGQRLQAMKKSNPEAALAEVDLVASMNAQRTERAGQAGNADENSSDEE